MHRLPLITALLAVALLPALAGEASEDGRDAWPQWRGPTGNGVALHGNPPLTWSETKNVRWKFEVPGLAASSPIVWGDRVYVTTAIETKRQGTPEVAAGGGYGLFSGCAAGDTAMATVVKVG